jgi:hypothetical protein
MSIRLVPWHPVASGLATTQRDRSSAELLRRFVVPARQPAFWTASRAPATSSPGRSKSCATSRAGSIRRHLDHGLASALESLAARTTVPTAVSCQDVGEVARDVELAVYFVACEALANVAKYARATKASVRLSRARSIIAIEVSR